MPGQVERGLGDLAVVLVEHSEDVSGRANPHQVAQFSLADQGPAAPAVADEVDDVDTRFGQRGELEMPPHPPQRRLLVLVGFFLIGDQPVQVDVGVHFRQVLAIEVLRVDLEHLDNQRADVLDL